jgi:uncharacterized protein
MTLLMPVVSNTSPILNLAIIGHLHLLSEQFSTVLIPEAVYRELRLDEDLPGSNDIRIAIKAGWLQVKPIHNRAFQETLARDLDRGEAEAIVLAIETNAERIVLDEREARRIAKTLNLPVTGILGILLTAQNVGSLSFTLAQLIKALQEDAGFYLAEPLIQTVLQQERTE